MPFVLGYFTARYFDGTIFQSLVVGLSILTGLAKSGSIQYVSVMVVLLKVAAFFTITMLAGQFVRKEIMDEKIYNTINDRFFG